MVKQYCCSHQYPVVYNECSYVILLDRVLCAGYYSGCAVFYDTNGNGELDEAEANSTTGDRGVFEFSLLADASDGVMLIMQVLSIRSNQHVDLSSRSRI